jgi:hypothetical protein
MVSVILAAMFDRPALPALDRAWRDHSVRSR